MYDYVGLYIFIPVLGWIEAYRDSPGSRKGLTRLYYYHRHILRENLRRLSWKVLVMVGSEVNREQSLSRNITKGSQ